MSMLDGVGGAFVLGPLVVLVLFPLTLLVSSVRTVATQGRRRRTGYKDRVGLVSGVGGAVSGCAVGHVLVPWGEVAPLLWSACLVATVVGTAVGATAWRDLPTVAAGRRTLRLLSTGSAVALAAALVVAVVVLANRPS